MTENIYLTKLSTSLLEALNLRCHSSTIFLPFMGSCGIGPHVLCHIRNLKKQQYQLPPFKKPWYREGILTFAQSLGKDLLLKLLKLLLLKLLKLLKYPSDSLYIPKQEIVTISHGMHGIAGMVKKPFVRVHICQHHQQYRHASL